MKTKKTRKEDRGTRHGKHAETAFRISFYVSAREKAIAVLSAELLKSGLTDVLREGLLYAATKAGVMENGEIKEKYRERVDTYQKILENERSIRKEN